jgi:hypothetical protein
MYDNQSRPSATSEIWLKPHAPEHLRASDHFSCVRAQLPVQLAVFANSHLKISFTVDLRGPIIPPLGRFLRAVRRVQVADAPPIFWLC